MKLTPALITAAACTALMASAPAASTAADNKANHTNIILIMADDLGAADLGCYGHPSHQTPHLDALAAGGVRFETFFATPVCSPTRVALMTGRRAPKTGWYNMSGLQPGGVGRNSDLATDETTFGQVFQKAGYHNAFAGKWQLTGNHLSTMLSDVGFPESLIWIYTGYLENKDDYLGGFEGKGTRKASRFWHPGVAKNGVHFATTPEDYGPDMFADFLVDFIDRRKDEPFFVYYPMVLTHRPWVDTPDARGLRENSLEALKHNVEYMDKIIGRLVDAVDRNGIRENTLIIFLGDNGTQTFGKGSATEWGARVPAIFNMPGTVTPGAVTRELSEIVDIFPTIADYAGIELDAALDIDGKSLRGVLEGTATNHRDYIASVLGHYRVIRTDQWLWEANTRERFGKLFYTAGRRDGLGYIDVTDVDIPAVRQAKRQLNRFAQEVPYPPYDPSIRWGFELLTDDRINQIYEYVHGQEKKLGVELVSLEGVTAEMLPSRPWKLERHPDAPAERPARGRSAEDDEDDVEKRMATRRGTRETVAPTAPETPEQPARERARARNQEGATERPRAAARTEEERAANRERMRAQRQQRDSE